MTQLVSRRGALASFAAIPLASTVPAAMLPKDPADAARVMNAVVEMLEAARTAAADPEIFVDGDVRLAAGIFMRLLDCSEDDAYTAATRLM